MFTTYDTTPSNAAMVRDILRMVQPWSMKTKTKKRAGRKHDGGYVMVDDLLDISAAYSIGINDDVSWDAHIVAHDIQVFQYDHTIAAPPEEHPLMFWRKVGLGVEDDSARSLLSLPSMLASNGHLGRRDLILKCDIEGAEFEVLRHLESGFLSHFRQIVMEIHCFDFLDKPEWPDRLYAGLAKLAENHTSVHIHGNNYAGFSLIGGVPVPSVMEVTLLRNDLDEFVDRGEIFPTPLDMPCNSASADFYLGTFRF